MKAVFQPERLTQVRQQLGINQSEAARRMNVAAMTYGRYEHGERLRFYMDKPRETSRNRRGDK